MKWAPPSRMAGVTAGLNWAPPNRWLVPNTHLPKCHSWSELSTSRQDGVKPTTQQDVWCHSQFELGNSQQDGLCHSWFELGTFQQDSVTAGLNWAPPNMWLVPNTVSTGHPPAGRLVSNSVWTGQLQQDGWCHSWFELGTSQQDRWCHSCYKLGTQIQGKRIKASDSLQGHQWPATADSPGMSWILQCTSSHKTKSDSNFKWGWRITMSIMTRTR